MRATTQGAATPEPKHNIRQQSLPFLSGSFSQLGSERLLPGVDLGQIVNDTQILW